MHLQHVNRAWQVGAERAAQIEPANLGREFLAGVGGGHHVRIAQVTRCVRSDLGVPEDHFVADRGDFDDGLTVARNVGGVGSHEDDRCAESRPGRVDGANNGLRAHFRVIRIGRHVAQQVDDHQQHGQGHVDDGAFLRIVIARVAQAHLAAVEFSLESFPEGLNFFFLRGETQLIVFFGFIALVVLADAAHNTVRDPLAPLPGAFVLRQAEHIQAGIDRRLEAGEVREEGAGEVTGLDSVLANNANRMARQLNARLPIGLLAARLRGAGFRLIFDERAQWNGDGNISDRKRVGRQFIGVLHQ